MAYVRRLIHRASVARPTVAKDEIGQSRSTLSVVSGMSAVACLLQDGDQKRLLESFGPDISAEAVVLFAARTDIRPNTQASDAKSDHLTITQTLRGATVQLGTWQVVATKNPGGAQRLIVAAVRRVTG